MNRNQFLKFLVFSLGALGAKTSLAQSSVVKKEVLIIGAGIAGLAAARKLVSDGFQVTILEARNRIGGRIWTDTSMGVPVEMGASWIQGVNGNPIKKLADQFKLQVISKNKEELGIFDGKGNMFGEDFTLKLEGHYKDFITKLYLEKESAQKNQSIESVKQNILSELGLKDPDKSALEWMIGSEIEIEYGAELKNIGLKYFDDEDSYPGNDAIFGTGFSEIISVLAKGLNIKTSHIVSKIEYDKKIKVQTNQGEFTSDYAVVTVPLGVLKRKKIQFIPELPASKQKSIDNLGMGVLNKIFLKFPKKFWQTDINRYGLITDTSRKMVEFWDLNPVKNISILTGFIAGNEASAFEKLSKQEIVKEYMDILKKMFGNKIPNPIETNMTKWNSDPFSFGAYSYLSLKSEIDDYNSLSEPVNEILFFGGEATNKNYPATVHGAFLSGEREADRIIEKSKLL